MGKDISKSIKNGINEALNECYDEFIEDKKKELEYIFNQHRAKLIDNMINNLKMTWTREICNRMDYYR